MILRYSRILLSLLVCQSLIYTPFVFAAALPYGDHIAPEVTHNDLIVPVKEGKPLTISATVTDNVGVKSVILFYRTKGTIGRYNRIPMTREDKSDVYSVILKDIHPPALEYYFQASDLAGNSSLYGNGFPPLVVAVIPSYAEGHAKEPVSAPYEPSVKEAMEEASKSSSAGKYKWLWIGLGVVGIAVLASGGGGSGGGDGGGGGGGNTSGTVVISAPVP